MTIPTAEPAALSVVIPCLNEAHHLAHVLKAIKEGAKDVEVIVVDGHSSDGSPGVARAHGARVLFEGPSRGLQLNRGARAASNETILFLHADTTVPQTFVSDVAQTLSVPGVILGAFRLKIGSPRPIFRLIEKMVLARGALLSMPYGDQGLFVRKKDFFQKLRGFKEIPIMEDLDLVWRARSLGKIALAKSHVTTSPRRWEEKGIVRTTLINQAMIVGYLMGVSPERLNEIYYSM